MQEQKEGKERRGDKTNKERKDWTGQVKRINEKKLVERRKKKNI